MAGEDGQSWHRNGGDWVRGVGSEWLASKLKTGQPIRMFALETSVFVLGCWSFPV